MSLSYRKKYILADTKGVYVFRFYIGHFLRKEGIQVGVHFRKELEELSFRKRDLRQGN